MIGIGVKIIQFIGIVVQVVKFPLIELVEVNQFVSFSANAIVSGYHMNTGKFVVMIIDRVTPVVRCFAF